MKIENSFILFDGVGEKTERNIWEKGYKCWEDVQGENVLPKRANLQKASKNLNAGNSKYFDNKLPSGHQWRMFENFKQDACYFDIETTGLSPSSNKVTTAAFYNPARDQCEVLTRDKDLSAKPISSMLGSADILVSFNGKRFDIPFLEKSFGIDVKTPHIDLMYTAKKVGLTGGLKQVEKRIGIDRQDDLDGRDAIRLWNKYKDTGDEHFLNKLKQYNKKDAENLETVAEKIKSRLYTEKTPNCI